MNVETVVPDIPEIRPDNIPSVLNSIKQLLDVREGRADPLDQTVTYRDLYRLNMLGSSSVNGKVMFRDPFGGLTFLDVPAADDAPDYSPPPAVTGLTANGAITNIILSFDAPSYHNHSDTEIWRSGTDDLGTAVRIGTTRGASLYADNVGATGVNRYYWARNISKQGVVGPFNATAGTLGTTGFVQTAHLADALITAQKLASGAVTTDALAGAAVTAAKIATGAVGEPQLADASITVAKHAAGLRPVEIVTSLPSAGTEGRTVYLTTDDKIYRDTGSTWTAAVPATDITGTLGTLSIADGAVTTAKIALAAITSALMAAAAITTTAIADDAITTPKLVAAAVTTAKINAGAVTATEIAAGAVTTPKIYAGAVTANEIAAAAVTTAKLDALAVTSDKIAANAIIAGKVAAGVISTTELAANAVTAAKLSILQHAVSGASFTSNSPSAGYVAWSSHTISWNGNTYTISSGNTNAEVIWFDRGTSTSALQGSTRSAFEAAYNPDDGDLLLAINTSGTYELIYNATLVSGGMLRTGVITADKISAGAITAGKIAANAIIAGDGAIANLAIDTAQMANGAITNAKIGSLAVDTANIAAGAIVAAKIADATITTAKIADAAITAAKIGDAEIVTAKIATAAITNALIANATIQGGKIAASTITASNLSVSTLSAISADMGTITAGTIALASSGHIRAGQTAYNTGSGFWLGIDSGTAKFSIGDGTSFMKWDGSTLSITAPVRDTRPYAAGTYTIARAGKESFHNDTTYVMVKEFYVARSGTLRVSWEMETTALGGHVAYARVYINGSATGSEHTETSVSSYVAHSEDVTVSAEDLVQLWVKTSNSVANCGIKDCRLKNSFPLGDVVLLDE